MRALRCGRKVSLAGRVGLMAPQTTARRAAPRTSERKLHVRNTESGLTPFCAKCGEFFPCETAREAVATVPVPVSKLREWAEAVDIKRVAHVSSRAVKGDTSGDQWVAIPRADFDALRSALASIRQYATKGGK